MPEKIKDKIEPAAGVIPVEKPNHRFWRTLGAVLIFVAAVAIISAGGLFVYAKNYDGKVYPGVYLGAYPLGGMTAGDISDFISGLDSRLGKEGITYFFEKDGSRQKVNVGTTLVEGDSVLEIISVKSDGIENSALSAVREAGGWRGYWRAFTLRFFPVRLTLPVEINGSNYLDILKTALAPFEQQPLDVRIKIIKTNPLDYQIIPEQTGVVFDYDGIMKQTSRQLEVFQLEPITISQQVVLPRTTARQLKNTDENISRVLSYGNIGLTYIDPRTKEAGHGRIGSDDIAGWLTPQTDEQGLVSYGLDREKVREYLENYKYILDLPAEESKFVMEGGQVQEFAGGASGQAYNVDKTLEAIDALMRARNSGAVGATSTVALIVETTEPKIKMADINNLGITAIIGAGTSTFRDSHTNRIKNIAHAVARLNGTIIAPGEEFSTTRYAGPFTAENGYLPEEVIKGNQIKKEIGGGMCQIGTTMFRMAMNSGMTITERTNHSLVVGYYADPVNGNPGTDATIYEPILDFKFLNDTGSYLLLQTKIDYKKQMLTFTLWGKPDGRSGYYTHPLVSRWIPAGEAKNIYTSTLAPGVKTCQNAFRGAIASFTYTRITSSSEKIDRVFSSQYRPLPKICMIGVDVSLCSGENNCSAPPTAPATGTPTAGAPATGAGTATGTMVVEPAI